MMSDYHRKEITNVHTTFCIRLTAVKTHITNNTSKLSFNE